MSTPMCINHIGIQHAMETIVIMNNVFTLFKALAWFVIILLVAVTGTDFVALFCAFPLTFVEIFEGPGSLDRARSATAPKTLCEVPCCEYGVRLSTPTCFREDRNFFQQSNCH